ncbi:MAG TPA: hypothetical protein VK021_02355 [Flavobacteriaceae bacterium]|nr:hypothetical protein [Flavobacteriaceae bacterium]
MKKIVLVVMVALLNLSCSGQNKEKTKKKQNEDVVSEQPKGTWTVNREFDEDGNLIRYDSIYSWSSSRNLDELSPSERDSLLESLKSRFYTEFSGFENQGFGEIISRDSLFSKRFFNDEFFESNFGRDYMDIEKMRQHMIKRQKEFLKKYQSDFIKSEEND